MADIDETISLFEHIRNRLPTGYGLGDDENIENDGVYNHKTFQQSLREDHEGDVGIFENNISEINILSGFLGYQGNIQVAVVTKNGDIDGAMKYLKEALENIKNNCKSTGIYVKSCKLINLLPLGKNSAGLHMCSMNILIKYVVLN